MTWVKIDDHFSDHPKLQGIGLMYPLAGWLYVSGLCYAAKHLTDGYLPEASIGQLANWDGIGYMGKGVSLEELIEALVRAGLWEQAVGGYRIHDYLHYNPSKADVLTEREMKRAGGRIRAATGIREGGRFSQHPAGGEVVPLLAEVHHPRTRTRTPRSNKAPREALRELPRDGAWWTAREADHPGVDLLAELDKAGDWRDIDKIKNVKIFFRNWLTKAPVTKSVDLTPEQVRARQAIS